MYVINDDCINCGACVADCPVDAIKEGDPKYTITEDCIDCGACVGSCPVDAINPG
jgi:ferredoxin